MDSTLHLNLEGIKHTEGLATTSTPRTPSPVIINSELICPVPTNRDCCLDSPSRRSSFEVTLAQELNEMKQRNLFPFSVNGRYSPSPPSSPTLSHSSLPTFSIGRLTTDTGPMYSGKTSTIVNKCRDAEYHRIPIAVIKPRLDNRYSDKAEVTTHNQQSCRAFALDNLSLRSTLELVRFAHIICIDEGHMFLEEEIVPFVRAVLETGRDVFVAGLTLTSNQGFFDGMCRLVAMSDDHRQHRATCFNCHREAILTAKVANLETTSIIDVGADEKYKAVCRDCFKNARHYYTQMQQQQQQQLADKSVKRLSGIKLHTISPRSLSPGRQRPEQLLPVSSLQDTH